MGMGPGGLGMGAGALGTMGLGSLMGSGGMGAGGLGNVNPNDMSSVLQVSSSLNLQSGHAELLLYYRPLSLLQISPIMVAGTGGSLYVVILGQFACT